MKRLVAKVMWISISVKSIDITNSHNRKFGSYETIREMAFVS